ncbi:oxidoreductase, partial [Rhizoctonia solani]
MSQPKLFTPIRVGDMMLSHRVILAPLTRFRADDEHVHHEIAVEYYSQRATTPGTLLISEGVLVSPEAGGYDNVPGIWNERQIAAWKKVVDAVHKRGSYIFLQLWASGRAADPRVLEKEGHPYVSSSPSLLERPGYPNVTPRELSKSEIKQYVESYARAAKNAVYEAGFDGVEIHAANGYLIDQFNQDVCNKRTDEYGGSIENRSRFLLEVLEAVVKEVGAKRAGIRFSPWARFQGMRMENPIPTFAYLVSEIAQRYSDLAYLHFIEPVASGSSGAEDESRDMDSITGTFNSNDFARLIWQPRPFFSAGGFKPESALVEAETKDTCVVIGRYFISNPDLPERLRRGIPLSPYNRDTFYTAGPKAAKGYIDYPQAAH